MQAEQAAKTTCACKTLACADAAAKPLLEGRGLLVEDYENLPEDQIVRYDRALDRVKACRDALSD